MLQEAVGLPYAILAVLRDVTVTRAGRSSRAAGLEVADGQCAGDRLLQAAAASTMTGVDSGATYRF